MIPDLAYTNKHFYTSNQFRSRSIYLLGLRTTGLYIRDLYHLVNALISTWSIIKTVILTKLMSA